LKIRYYHQLGFQVIQVTPPDPKIRQTKEKKIFFCFKQKGSIQFQKKG